MASPIDHFNLEPRVTPIVFANSDEEIGSRESTRHISRLAAAMNRVFVLEPSLGPDGRLKTARKGIGRFTIKVKGRAAHAGLDPEQGASAILELSHAVQALFALNDPDRGVTVNVGTIKGGLRPIVIALESTAVIDVRVQTQEDTERIEKAIHALEPSVSGTTLDIDGRIGRPAPDLVCGPATNTDAAVDLVHKLCGLRALNLLRQDVRPELNRLLDEWLVELG